MAKFLGVGAIHSHVSSCSLVYVARPALGRCLQKFLKETLKNPSMDFSEMKNKKCDFCFSPYLKHLRV
jgi:hypothetical protein